MSDQIALAAAVTSGVALVVTLVFAVLNRRYTRAQIALMRDQLTTSKEQFDRTNTPNVHFEVFTIGKPVDEKGVYVRVSNNHPSVPVGDVQVWLEAPAIDGNRMWLFFVGHDLRPQQTIETRNAVTIQQMVEHFTGDGSREGAVFGGDTMTGAGFDTFPLTLRFSYVPRQAGATKTEGTLECQLGVLRP